MDIKLLTKEQAQYLRNIFDQNIKTSNFDTYSIDYKIYIDTDHLNYTIYYKNNQNVHFKAHLILDYDLNLIDLNDENSNIKVNVELLRFARQVVNSYLIEIDNILNDAKNINPKYDIIIDANGLHHLVYTSRAGEYAGKNLIIEPGFELDQNDKSFIVASKQKISNKLCIGDTEIKNLDGKPSGDIEIYDSDITNLDIDKSEKIIAKDLNVYELDIINSAIINIKKNTDRINYLSIKNSTNVSIINSKFYNLEILNSNNVRLENCECFLYRKITITGDNIVLEGKIIFPDTVEIVSSITPDLFKEGQKLILFAKNLTEFETCIFYYINYNVSHIPSEYNISNFDAISEYESRFANNKAFKYRTTNSDLKKFFNCYIAATNMKRSYEQSKIISAMREYFAPNYREQDIKDYMDNVVYKFYTDWRK